MKAGIKVLLCTLLFCSGLISHPVQAAPEFYLVTYGPGAEVWERFGHNALWLYDVDSGEQALYNFGFFDFEQHGFFVNFLRGRMLYYAAATDPAREFPYYEHFGRSIEYQRLRLTSAQAEYLADELRRSVLPEHREYLYDYYLANCSTRVRDALDQALGGALQSATEDEWLETSFRRSSLAQVQDDFILYLGLQLGLGRPSDRPISRWESFYLPQNLALAVSEGGWSDAAVVYAEGRPWGGMLKRPWVKTLGLSLCLLGLIVLPLAWARYRKRSKSGLLGVRLWFFISGLAGWVLALLWLFTDHQAAWQNENLLVLNPLALILAFAPRWLGGRGLAWVLLFSVFAEFIVKFLPGEQFNYDLLLCLGMAQVTALSLFLFSKFYEKKP